MTQSHNPSDVQGGENNAQQESPPVAYQSKVRSLLGVPSSRHAMVMRQTMPPVGFEYANAPASGTFFAPEASVEPGVAETALPSRERQAFTEPADASEESSAENIPHPVETPVRSEINPPSVREQKTSSDSDPMIFGHDQTTLSRPRAAQRGDEHAVKRETSRAQDDFVIETVQEDLSSEPLSQEHSSVRQFNMDIPGISDRVVSFPALSDDSKDRPSLASQTQPQTPRASSRGAEAHQDDSPVDVQDAASRIVPSSGPDSGSGRLQTRQQSDASKVEDTMLPLPSSSRYSLWRRGVEASRQSAVTPDFHSQPADTSKQSIGDAASRTSPSMPVTPAMEQKSTRRDEARFFAPVQGEVNPQAEPIRPNGVAAREAIGGPDFRYSNATGTTASYKETLEQIEQIRNSMRQLAARDAAPSPGSGQETGNNEPQGPPAPVVIVQRAANPSRTPRAFWERRYLSHFRLRTLR